jgi:signal transduction histidine kinase
LSCFDGKKSFTNYTTNDGLSDNTCYFILEGCDRNLWIGTAKGINRYDGHTFKAYTSREGLASLGIVEGACLKDSRGYLWFGTVHGITRYNPKLDRPNSVPPPIYITHVNVFGRKNEDYLGNAAPDNIELQYNQNYLRFDFTGISFTSPEDVSYRYRLQGIDRVWFETRNRYISYPYLPPGNFTFEVKAINNDGVESTESAAIHFRILPPLWRTWWFIVLAVCFALAFTLTMALWRIRLANEKIALREKNKQLIMAQKMELLGILAGGAVHDLKNLLSIIIGYSKMVARQAAENNDMKGVNEKIKNTAVTALQVVKQILAFTRRQYDETVAANLPDLLDDIIDILRITTPPEIEIIRQQPEKELRLYINPTKFQQVVLNLCFNAVHAMEQGGKLDIRLYESGDGTATRIILEIADTGCGIKEDLLDKIFDPLFTTKEPGKGTGLGLFVVKQIVDEYKGRIDVRSKPGEGTVFRISFQKASS